jgi:Rrf2 family transcriptional regulator, nitric oxide-sensitive transcriptional repressor
MHLNLQTDYALRILMALAASGRQMSIDEIAASYGISRNHVAKVAHRLQTLGHIETVRGRGGGLRLGKLLGEINVGAVVRQFERLDSFVECMTGPASHCRVSGACGLQGALGLALQDFLKRLDGYTLADLLPDHRTFAQRLGLEAA